MNDTRTHLSPHGSASVRRGTSPLRRLAVATVVTTAAAFVVSLSPVGAASAALTSSLTPTADTMTHLTEPKTNFGTAGTIYGSPTDWKAFLRFPTAAIDDDALISGAKLRLFGTTTSTSHWQIHPAASGWSEAGTTYTTMPSWNNSVLATSLGTAAAGAWNEISLPVSAVSTTADTNLGVMGTVSGKIGFQSRQGANAPQLVLTYAADSGDTPAPDTTAPDTTLTTTPDASTTGTSASFSFTATEASTFQCALDGAAFAACTSPQAYSGLAVGAHTFRVRATDPAGNVDATPASYTWQITSNAGTMPPSLTPTADTMTHLTEPKTNFGTAGTIYGSPTDWKAFLRFPTAAIDDDALISGAKLRLFGTTTSTSHWQIHPAASGWSEAGTTYTTMPSWNNSVLATSLGTAAAGAWNEISLPVSAVSTTADTNLGVMGTVSGKIGFQSRQGANAPQLVLTYAADSGDTPAPDTTAPDTTLTTTPDASTTGTSASFSFTATEASTFQCALDGAAFAACTSPQAYSGLAVGAHTFRVRATDPAGNVDATPASYTWQITSGSTGTQPVGPGGTWLLKFDDEFNGTSLDTSKWSPNWYGEGGSMNSVGTYAANQSVSGGNLNLVLASATSGALVHTDYGSGRYQLPVGGFAEARISFPGSSSRPIYNWPAWWISGPSWPAAGEHDIAEGLGGKLTVNYHSPSGSHNQGAIAGTWGNGFHTYGIYRKASSADVYWDGKLVKSYPTDDNGKGEELILNVGGSGTYGAASQIKVDYVRAWQ